MGVKGLDSVVGRLKLTLSDAKGKNTEAAITEMLIVGGANSQILTPADTGNLRQSQGRQTYPGANGWAGSVFYGAYYAGYVNRASGKLKGQPRGHFGATRAGVAFGGGTGKGRYWDPAAEPHFLEKGMEEMATDMAQLILKKHMAV